MDTPSNNIPPADLARLAVETFIRENRHTTPPSNPEGVLARRAGVFVTLRTVGGELRGCIGTIEPVRSDVGEEIIRNAIYAATGDPRFPPVRAHELANLTYGVDVLNPAEPARGPEDLDPAVYGVIIESIDGRRRGLLLPGIEGLDTVEKQWLAVHHKAGIPLGSPVRVERFTVTRYGKE
jgi:AmmeMemoRadiSam system protein A